ncbi:unnamed protein product [Phytomonas sp. Hart1]|nr:unnamed protein product [Phytomonas sp. Hart1]|eukprot:CCW70338.1 unnamed protein product [Phytomonas sp. isolate Hart1]
MLRFFSSFSNHTSYWCYKTYPLHHAVRSKQSNKTLQNRFIPSNDFTPTNQDARFVSEQKLPPSEHVPIITSSSTSGGASTGSIPRIHEELRILKDELRSTQRQLLQAQLHLAQMEHQPLSRFYTTALEQLARLDREAHEEATAMRYTAMALQASHDRLEVELRRVLGIGLTAEAIDAAALEASTRHYIRANIGFRVEHVSEEPAVLTAASKVAASAVEYDGIEESGTSTSDLNENNKK